jgi:NAD(P)-dependent dehydrogenase (short-subunit alcohol dehydrogenase family)
MKTNNKVALITGANRGLGLQTARELGKLGITLLLGVRDVSKSQEALKELKGLWIFPKEGKRAQCSRPFPMMALRVDISIWAKNCRGN